MSQVYYCPHTSGIRHYTDDSNTVERYPRLKHALPRFQDSPLLHEPGTAYHYTTYGYTALGIMIEEAGGARYERYMRDNVWEPAGMAHTDVEDVRIVVKNKAGLYSRGGRDRMFHAAFSNLSYKYPGGGIISTAGDLCRFAHAFYTHKLVNKETYEQMITSYTLADGTATGYGFGWGTGEDEEMGLTIGHSGGQEGTSTLLRAFPDRDIAVATLSNVEGTFEAINEVTNALAKIAAAQ